MVSVAAAKFLSGHVASSAVCDNPALNVLGRLQKAVQDLRPGGKVSFKKCVQWAEMFETDWFIDVWIAVEIVGWMDRQLGR